MLRYVPLVHVQGEKAAVVTVHDACRPLQRCSVIIPDSTVAFYERENIEVGRLWLPVRIEKECRGEFRLKMNREPVRAFLRVRIGIENDGASLFMYGMR